MWPAVSATTCSYHDRRGVDRLHHPGISRKIMENVHGIGNAALYRGMTNPLAFAVVRTHGKGEITIANVLLWD